ncbi:glycosyltransferase family 92 protein F13G3.3-like [Huso huso]|uniref:Glycosyltransferase family 92 protein n=1 Tax=Huso huso TaxID=61971 RepID=A0ABR0Z7W3_HUSHU
MKDSNSPLRVHKWRTRSWNIKKFVFFGCLLAVGLILVYINNNSTWQTENNTSAPKLQESSDDCPLKTIVPVENAQDNVIPGSSNERPLKTIVPVKNAQDNEIRVSSNDRPLKTIIPVENAQAFVISAYYDDRFPPPVVRIIGIVDRQQSNQSLYCHLRFHNETISVEAEVDIHSNHFGFRYGSADLNCKCPGITLNSSVSVTTSPQNNASAPRLSIRNIKKGKPSHFTYEFAVCISVMFRNYSNVLQFIQTIEMHRLLGVQKVFIYKTSSSRELDKVLGHYIKEGIVEVIPWQITSFINVSHSWKPKAGGDLLYNGQLAALNDCVYRNMYTTRYVALTDLDEIIIPHRHANWGELMKFLEKQYPYKEGFLFDEHHLFNSVDGDRFAYKEWNNVPGVNILRHVNSEPVDRKSNARKMILNPRTVVQTSVHSCLKCIDRKLFVFVSSDVAWLHHYRYQYKTRLGKDKLIKDTTLWNYSDQLIKNVNSLLHATNILRATQ